MNCPPNPPQGGFSCHNTYMKNTHIEHPEDSILTGTLAVLDAFLMTCFLSVKIDGAPAIVWGKNPATGNFFVGTKSVFNKKKIMINECHADIDQNHGHQEHVAEILHACFDYLPWTDQIIQGDFIGFGGDREYTPNTITYEFPFVVDDAAIIMAPHTVYTAESDLRDAVAAPLKKEMVDPDGECKFVQPIAYIWDGLWGQYGKDSFEELEEMVNFAKVMAGAVEFVDQKEAARYKKELNACIREGREIDHTEWDNPNLINFWKLVKSIKEDALHLCRYAHGPNAYIGQDRIDSEGYVMHTESGSWKLINREVFSHANFSMGVGA